jgi:hypothetical protein
VLNLAEYASIRLLADRVGLESLDREGQTVVLKFRADARLDPGFLLRVVQARGDLKLLPPGTVKLDLRAAGAAMRPAVAGRVPGNRVLPPDALPRPRSRGTDPVAAGSWWAARARAGEVKPGFSRDEILRPAKEDPRAEGGLFGRLGGLLRELSLGAS